MGSDTEDVHQNNNNNSADKRMQRINQNEELDAKYGYTRHRKSTEKVGWLVNFQSTEFLDESKRFVSAVEFYFLGEDNENFKATYPFNPYFYLGTKDGTERDVISYLNRKYQGKIIKQDVIEKEDMDLKNHLIGLKRTFIKLQFLNMDELIKVRNEIRYVVKRNKEMNKKNAYEMNFVHQDEHFGNKKNKDQLENIIDIREYDVPYDVRVCIDLSLNVGKWYSVKGQGYDAPTILPRHDLLVEPSYLSSGRGG
jgi:DNA polymerase epsilon subunit 1